MWPRPRHLPVVERRASSCGQASCISMADKCEFFTVSSHAKIALSTKLPH
jgi:hypothetical protein